MSSKKRKGLSPWSACDHCNAIILQKDTVLHREKSCPPNSREWIHPYIMEQCLYANVEIFQLQDGSLRFIPVESRVDFVLMPYHVLQLCKIPIGDPVVIKFSKETSVHSFVKLAWPLQEKTSNFTIALSKEASNLNSLSPNSQVTVMKLQEQVPVANVVILSCENIECPSEVEQLMLKLKKENINKIYCIGNRLLFRDYGKKSTFKIVDINASKNSEDGEVNNDCFYLIGPETKFVTNDFRPENQKKKKLLSRLGGLSEVINELKDVISLVYERKNMSGLCISKGILIHGPIGTGKTTLMEAVAEHFTDNIVRIRSSRVFSKIVGETEKELQSYFDKAKQISPSIILIDDLDVLCSKSNSSSEYERRILGFLTLLMDDLNNDEAPVVVLATTSKIDRIDKMLRSSTRFGKEIEIYVPSSYQRFEILNLLLSDIDHNLTESDVRSIADSSHAFVGADLVSLVSKAVLKHHQTGRGAGEVSLEDLQWALGKTKPSAMKEIVIEIPNVKWTDIGGQEDLKLKLRQSVEWPLKYRESFTRLGITPPKGLLMFGPPGCSKTMIAKALATESQLNFISVKGPELFSKWVGESEGAVRKVFRRARQAAPSIIFFDELDAIGGERNSSSGSSVQERVLAQMLVELDGVEPLENVTVIAATNRLDRIDPALLRPGRLDRVVYVPLPDFKTRGEIIRLQLGKTIVDEDVSVEELVGKTDGYSGAEIVAACREAALKALEENLEAEKVSRKHFLEALEIVTPRTPKSLLKMYEKQMEK